MDARALLCDAAQRPLDSVEGVLDGASAEVINAMPEGRHNSIAWLIWHAARQQDAQVAELAGQPEVWASEGWADRFGLDLPADATGFGHEPGEVARVTVDDPSLLRGYLEAVVGSLRGYVNSLSDADLDEVVDEGWTAPVTRGVRLVSTIDDAAAHVGQAAYVRGLLDGWRAGY